MNLQALIRRRRLQHAAIAIVLLHNLPLRHRRERYARARLRWDREVQSQLLEQTFELTFRMAPSSFENLLNLLYPDLAQDVRQAENASGGSTPITPVNMLQMTLRYLAGGKYLDIRVVAGVSVSSFYRIVNRTLRAIASCQDLRLHFPASPNEQNLSMKSFERISSGGVLKGCIGAIDGWLCGIKSPSARDAAGVGTSRYFSGHYRKPGLNVQAVCDSRSCFTYVSLETPGSTNDARAYQEASISRVVADLPCGVYIVGDNAYPVSEHLLTPFTANQLSTPYHDSFNFHVSQLRIRIEMAFGILTTKWGIFRSPLQTNLTTASLIIQCAMKLHNYVIRQKYGASDDYSVEQESIDALPNPHDEHGLGYLPSDGSTERGASFLRMYLVNELRSRNTLRP
jgi:hypothetical protein